MKRYIVFIVLLLMILTLCACNPQKWRVSTLSTPLENELKTSARIIFVNTKEPTLKFTVADSKVIEQIAAVIGKIKDVAGSADVMPDYNITFYLPNGVKKTFNYWMGTTQNNKEANLKDEQGTFYNIPDSLDVYIINSTKMYQRPNNFTDLYSASMSECISRLEKDKTGNTVIGIDITSDRRMRKYTMSYEDEKIFNGISAEGYTVQKLTDKSKYTYTMSYVTNIYNPDKAKITMEVMKVADKTKQMFVAEAALENNNTWVIKISEIK